MKERRPSYPEAAAHPPNNVKTALIRSVGEGGATRGLEVGGRRETDGSGVDL